MHICWNVWNHYSQTKLQLKLYVSIERSFHEATEALHGKWKDVYTNIVHKAPGAVIEVRSTIESSRTRDGRDTGAQSPLITSTLLWVVMKTYTGSRQLATAAITISQHGGRRSRYKIIFTVYAIIKHPFLVLGFVYIGIAWMLLLNIIIWMIDRYFCC